MFPKKELYYIQCSTGCSCCSDENFGLGFFDNPKEPNEIINQWRQGNENPLASQYARYGIYELKQVDAEFLPDGRMIVDDQVFNQSIIGGKEKLRWY